jgi:hypothetical protein
MPNYEKGDTFLIGDLSQTYDKSYTNFDISDGAIFF